MIPIILVILLIIGLISENQDVKTVCMVAIMTILGLCLIGTLIPS